MSQQTTRIHIRPAALAEAAARDAERFVREYASMTERERLDWPGHAFDALPDDVKGADPWSRFYAFEAYADLLHQAAVRIIEQGQPAE